MLSSRRPGRSSLLGRAGLLLLCLAVAACAGRTPVVAPSVAESPLPAAEPQPYRLEVGDLVSIKFWGNPELDEELRILPDGSISLPFVDAVQAAGRTPSELDAELTRRYTGELANPEITVIVRELAGRRIFVGGEVTDQGPVSIVGQLTLHQAIYEAGGFLDSARRRQVLLIRSQPDGERIARSIDLRPAQSGVAQAADIVLQPSDIVFVPRTKITNVNLFVEQYIDRLLPIRPVATVDLYGDGGLFDSGSGSSSTSSGNNNR